MARVAGAAGVRTGKMTWGSGVNSTPETMFLWLLLGLELGAQVALRRYFRRQHGG